MCGAGGIGKEEEVAMGRFVKCVKVKFRLYAIAHKLAKLEAANRKPHRLKLAA